MPVLSMEFLFSSICIFLVKVNFKTGLDEKRFNANAVSCFLAVRYRNVSVENKQQREGKKRSQEFIKFS